MAVQLQEIVSARSPGSSAKAGGALAILPARREVDFRSTLAAQNRQRSQSAAQDAGKSTASAARHHDDPAEDSARRTEKSADNGAKADQSASAGQKKATRSEKGEKSRHGAPDETADAAQAQEHSAADSSPGIEEEQGQTEDAAAAAEARKAKKDQTGEEETDGQADPSADAADAALLAASAANPAKPQITQPAAPATGPQGTSKTTAPGLKKNAARATAAGAKAGGSPAPAGQDTDADVAALKALAGDDGSAAPPDGDETAPASKKDDKGAGPPGLGQPGNAALANGPALGAPAVDAAAAQAGAKATNQVPSATDGDGQPGTQALDAMQATVAGADHKTTTGAADDHGADGSAFRDLLAHLPGDKPSAPASPAPPAAAPAAPRPELRFAEANHPSIVQGISAQALAKGGTMHLRLDPPELGAMQVTVNVKDGLVSASFQTSNDEATRLLSHSLHDLKSLLESQGVQVQKLQVQQQSPADSSAREGNGDGSRQQQQAMQDQSARQEQQRKEMIRRMWAKLGVGQDPLDVTG